MENNEKFEEKEMMKKLLFVKNGIISDIFNPPKNGW